MVDLVLYHILGIACLFGLLYCGSVVIRILRRSKLKSIMLSIAAGLLYFGIAFSLFLLIAFRTTFIIDPIVVNYTSVTGRIYLCVLFLFGIIAVTSFIGAYIFKNSVNNTLARCIAGVPVLAIVLQPIIPFWLSKLSGT